MRTVGTRVVVTELRVLWHARFTSLVVMGELVDDMDKTDAAQLTFKKSSPATAQNRAPFSADGRGRDRVQY